MNDEKRKALYAAAEKWLCQFQPDQLIYPGVLKKDLGISMADAYDILDTFREEKRIRMCLEVSCTHCKRLTGQIYETVNALPASIECPYCGEVIVNPIADAIVIFKTCHAQCSCESS